MLFLCSVHGKTLTHFVSLWLKVSSSRKQNIYRSELTGNPALLLLILSSFFFFFVNPHVMCCAEKEGPYKENCCFRSSRWATA